MSLADTLTQWMLLAAEQAGLAEGWWDGAYRYTNFNGGSLPEMLDDGTVRSAGHRDAVWYPSMKVAIRAEAYDGMNLYPSPVRTLTSKEQVADWIAGVFDRHASRATCRLSGHSLPKGYSRCTRCGWIAPYNAMA